MQADEEMHECIEGSRPEWCISSMIIYIVEIHHSGWKPSVCMLFMYEKLVQNVFLTIHVTLLQIHMS